MTPGAYGTPRTSGAHGKTFQVAIQAFEILLWTRL
jgi:hypothetical protein